jgi:hypothetical protein
MTTKVMRSAGGFPVCFVSFITPVDENCICRYRNLKCHNLTCVNGRITNTKVWGSYKEVWQCNEKYKRLGSPEKGCQTPHITEEEIKARFLTAFNHMMHDRDGLIEDCRLAQNVLCDTTAIDTELAE